MSGMIGRHPALLWGVCALATTAAAGAAVVASARGLAQVEARVADAVVVALFVVTGAVVLAARPGHRIGLLLWGGGALWGLASLPVELAVAALMRDPDRPAVALAVVVAMAVRGAGWIAVVVGLPLLFPDGQLISPRWRPAAWLAVCSLAVFSVASLATPEPLDYRLTGVRNPMGVPSEWRVVTDLLAVAGLGLVVATALIGLAAVVTRWRRGNPLTRQRVGALAVAVAVCVLVAALIAADQGRTAVGFSLAVAPLPVAVGVAVLQHGLYDVRLAVNRTLVYGLLTAAVVGLYVLVVGGLGAMLRAGGEGWLPLVAAGVVAVAFQPLREAVQRSVNRLTYGSWDEPAEVVRRLGVRLSDAVAPDVTLPAVVDALAEALRLPYVAVLDADGGVLAARGEPRDDVREVPLVHQRERAGSLLLAAPNRGPRRNAADQRLLDALAAQLAPVVRALELARQLQASRERLVLSREEERRRLRRDLHDGLGPALAGLSLRVDTARNTVGEDPAVDRVLLELREEVQEAVADVRRVVEDLRPAALDDLGLVGALEALAARLAAGPLTLAVEARRPLPPLPAAVEVAAYRIVQEALTNAVRHSGATAVCVRVEVPGKRGELRVEVADDGRGASGTPSGGRRGHGLTTMRERAEEIGGAVTVGEGPDRGTVVTAVLPLPDAPGAPA